MNQRDFFGKTGEVGGESVDIEGRLRAARRFSGENSKNAEVDTNLSDFSRGPDTIQDPQTLRFGTPDTDTKVDTQPSKFDQVNDTVVDTESSDAAQNQDSEQAITERWQENPPFEIEGEDIQFLKELGQGGMGKVYLVKKLMARAEMEEGHYGAAEQFYRRFVLKVLRPDMMDNEFVRNKFIQEIQIHAQVDKEPFIVPAYDAVRVKTRTGQETVGVLLKYVEDGDLFHFIEDIYAEERMEGKEMNKDPMIYNVGTQLAKATGEMHKKGLVHVDIKSQNILIDKKKGRTMLSDFGIARALDEAGIEIQVPTADLKEYTTKKIAQLLPGEKRAVLGSPSYMAPELFSTDVEPSIATDIYSIGSVLYEIRTGHYAVPDTDGDGEQNTDLMALVIAKREKQIPSIKDRIGEDEYIPSAFDPLIETLIKLDPEDRKSVTINGINFDKLDTAEGLIIAFDALAFENNLKVNTPWDELETYEETDLQKNVSTRDISRRDTVLADTMPSPTPNFARKEKQKAGLLKRIWNKLKPKK